MPPLRDLDDFKSQLAVAAVVSRDDVRRSVRRATKEVLIAFVLEARALLRDEVESNLRVFAERMRDRIQAMVDEMQAEIDSRL